MESRTPQWPDFREEPTESLGEDEPIARAKPAAVAEGDKAAVETPETAGEQKRRRRRRRSRKPKGATTSAAAAGDEEGEEEATVETDAPRAAGPEREESPRTAEATPAADAPGARPKRRRHRSRRKSGPKKDAADDRAEPAPSARADTPRAVKSRPADRLSEEDDEPSDELSEHLQDSAEAGATGIGHRGIPNWQEAIDLIISANMQARAKKPGGDIPSRSRGGRGRSGRRGPSRTPT